jgi:hypothetical protein
MIRRIGNDINDPSDNEELNALMNRDVAGRHYSWKRAHSET